MSTSKAVGSSGLWRCDCLRLNLDGERCPCGRDEHGDLLQREIPAASGTGMSRPVAADATDAEGWPLPSPLPESDRMWVVLKALGAVAAVLVFNVALQLLVVNQIRDGHLSIGAGVTFELVGGLVFYVTVGALVFNGIDAIGVRPLAVRGDRVSAIGAGALRGAAVAGAIVAIATLANHGDADPSTALLVSRSAWGLLTISAALMIVAAPLVEELVFRGVLAESLRPYGLKLAITASAVAFAVAHVHPGVPVPNLAMYLLYYFAAGRMLAKVYFRRGLYGSIAAHALFNGTLVLATVLTLQGGAHTVTAHGVSAELPAGWHTAAAPPGEDLAALGPQLASIEIAHRDYVGPAPDIDYLAANLMDSGNRFGTPLHIDPSTVHHTLLPMGDAIDAQGTTGDLRVRMLVVPRGNRMWVIVIHSVDDAADNDTNAIVNSLQLAPRS